MTLKARSSKTSNFLENLHARQVIKTLTIHKTTSILKPIMFLTNHCLDQSLLLMANRVVIDYSKDAAYMRSVTLQTSHSSDQSYLRVRPKTCHPQIPSFPRTVLRKLSHFQSQSCLGPPRKDPRQLVAWLNF